MMYLPIYMVVLLAIILYYKDTLQLQYSFNGFSLQYGNVFNNPYISYFADEKTEAPTDKKLRDARQKGQTAKSNDLNSLVTLIVSVIAITVFGSKLFYLFKDTMTYIIKEIPNIDLSEKTSYKIVEYAIIQFIKSIWVILIPIMIGGIVVNLAQVGFMFSTKSIKGDLNRINPLNGIKRIFSKRALYELFKNLISLIIVSAVVYFFFLAHVQQFYNVTELEMEQILPFVKDISKSLSFQIIFVMIVVGIIDFYYQRYAYKKELRMTKQEIKEEYKESEGDPLIKALRKQKQRQLVFNRMISEVPKATVIVTNPTHYAVAIRYDLEEDDVPVVVAKGMNYIAQKIKDIAKENDIPIIENKILARTLYKKVEVFDRIPMDLYQAVAELLAMIYRLNKRNK